MSFETCGFCFLMSIDWPKFEVVSSKGKFPGVLSCSDRHSVSIFSDAIMHTVTVEWHRLMDPAIIRYSFFREGPLLFERKPKMAINDLKRSKDWRVIVAIERAHGPWNHTFAIHFHQMRICKNAMNAPCDVCKQYYLAITIQSFNAISFRTSLSLSLSLELGCHSMGCHIPIFFCSSGTWVNNKAM